MIYVTGDIHRKDMERFDNFALMSKMNRDNDIVIVAGDFGMIWTPIPDEQEKRLLEFFDNAPFRFAFVDGNHENFDRLLTFPVEEWNGGKIHRISDNIIHLMRGEIYDIPTDDTTQRVFTFGGARSVDAIQRIMGIDWWTEEIPSYKEEDYGLYKLEEVGYCVDYIITHECPSKIIKQINSSFREYSLTYYFDYVDDLVDYQKWIFGHHHIDASFDSYPKFQAVFHDIIAL